MHATTIFYLLFSKRTIHSSASGSLLKLLTPFSKLILKNLAQTFLLHEKLFYFSSWNSSPSSTYSYDFWFNFYSNILESNLLILISVCLSPIPDSKFCKGKGQFFSLCHSLHLFHQISISSITLVSIQSMFAKLNYLRSSGLWVKVLSPFLLK